MYNIAISVAAGVITALIFSLILSPWASILPCVLVLGGTYYYLARRTVNQVQLLMGRANQALQSGKFDQAVKILKSGLEFSKWQVMIDGQIKGQIGYIIYLQKNYDDALYYLRQAGLSHYIGQAMYAACLYRKKKYDEMEAVLEKAAPASKKVPFIWAIYAYLMDKSGNRAKAREILMKGLEHNENNEDLKANLLALQNNKRMKMKRFGDLWYQFWLEPLPAKYTRPSRQTYRR